MENLIVFIVMIFLCISSSNRGLLYLIAGSCALAEVTYIAGIDIALYYGVNALISAATALIAALHIKSVSAYVLSVLMLAQGLLCLSLVPNWPSTVNSALQFNLYQFNDILGFILIALGITGSDNYINTKLNNS
jgi:hypothetical protein